MNTLNDINGATDHDVSFYLSEVDVKEFRQHLAAFSGEQRTLRDWIAGMALSSMTVAPDYSKGACNAAMAERAYCIADAMLAARKEAK